MKIIRIFFELRHVCLFLTVAVVMVAVYGMEAEDLDARYDDISRFSEVLRRNSAAYTSKRDVNLKNFQN